MNDRAERVAVFDIDGTLANTSDVDAECYVRALDDTFGITGQSGDWRTYRDVTDSGILAEILSRWRGREADAREQQVFIDNFVTLLSEAFSADRNRFREIPGARSFVRQLITLGWTVTIATGGWRDSALRKLSYAGFSGHEFAMATANDSRQRTEIIRKSLSRAGVHLPTGSRIVVFGDAIWDVKAARALGLPIIGVAPANKTHDLLTAGARGTIIDYSDQRAVLDLMDTAVTPGTST